MSTSSEQSQEGTTTLPMFTHWGRAVDDPSLRLWIQDGAWISEIVELDVTDLPSRPEILARTPEHIKKRMLWEAREVAKGNVSLDPAFPGYSHD